MIDLPLTRADWSGAGRAVQRTLADPGLLAVAVLVGLAVALLGSASRRLQFVLDVLTSGGLSVGFKAEFLLLSFPVGGATAGPLDAIAIVAVATIAGITGATLVRTFMAGNEWAGDPADRDAGLALGGLGIATAALGPAVLAGIAGIAGVDGALATFPLGGLEGSLLAVPAMALSTHWLATGLRGEGDDREPTGPGDR